MNREELTCKPLDSIEEMFEFLQNPPPWRSLCQDLKPHSNFAINNWKINNKHSPELSLENPQSFCHYDPEEDIDVERVDRKNIPKTLICHDMANGYHDDSFVDGTGNADAYTFYNWAAVDVFCYFSHHLITIPPLGWINVAHQHGVKVIGTLITEWKDGEAWWERVLTSREEWRRVAAGLAALARLLRFDGWLLNVENKIKEPARLVEFVQELRAQLRAARPGALLLWYDSVTAAGALHWQNGLTLDNKVFFDACDGIFTNYSWSEEQVRASAALAGARRTDVYLGVDVWGRNFYGGGKFNTQAAVKMGHKYGLSLAIFAPAWTHEAATAAAADGAPDEAAAEGWALRERALWGSLWPLLSTKLPHALPFTTSFCRGYGYKRRLFGEVICPVPWYNLRHMQYQPNSNHGAHGYILTDAIEKSRSGAACDGVADLDAEDQPLEPSSSGKQFKRKVDEESAHVNKTTETEVHCETVTEVKQEAPTAYKKSVSTLSSKGVALWARRGRECQQLQPRDSFHGGACLQLNPQDCAAPDPPSLPRPIRLFHCDFNVDEDLVVCTVTKSLPEAPNATLELEVVVVGGDGARRVVVLDERPPPGPRRDRARVFPVNSGHDDDNFRDLQRYLLLNEPQFYVPVENSYGWQVRYYVVRVRGAVRALRCRPAGSLLLGHLALCHYRATHQPQSI